MWIQQTSPNEHDALSCDQLQHSSVFARKRHNHSRQTHKAVPDLLGLGATISRNGSVQPVGDDPAHRTTDDIEETECCSDLATLGLVPAQRLLIPRTQDTVQSKLTCARDKNQTLKRRTKMIECLPPNEQAYGAANISVCIHTTAFNESFKLGFLISSIFNAGRVELSPCPSSRA